MSILHCKTPLEVLIAYERDLLELNESLKNELLRLDKAKQERLADLDRTNKLLIETIRAITREQQTIVVKNGEQDAKG